MQQEQPVEWWTFKRTGCLGWFKSVPKAKTWAPHLPGVRWMVEPARAAACSVTRRGRRWLKNKSGPCSFLQIKMYWTNRAHSCFTPFLGCSAVRTRRAESRSCDTDPMACKAQKSSLWPFIGVCQPLAETVAAEASGKGLSERVFARSPSTRRSGSLTTVLRRDLSSALHLHSSSDGVLTPPAACSPVAQSSLSWRRLPSLRFQRRRAQRKAALAPRAPPCSRALVHSLSSFRKCLLSVPA